jgi:hypothetical protein
MTAKKVKALSASLMVWHHSVLLHHIGQRKFKYSDITAAKKIHTPTSSSPNRLQEQEPIKQYFSK